MRIGTWNLECVNFNDRNRDRLAFLKNRKADVWVLTETHDEINLSETHPYAAHSELRAKSKNDMRWVSIWSRYPIVDAVVTSDPVRSTAMTLDTPIGHVLMFGTVWPWHSDQGEAPWDPVWDTWARQPPVIARQNKEWSRLKETRPEPTLCIAGDLNMTFGGPNDYGSRDGRLEAAIAMQKHDLVCTTAWARLPATALAQSPIDHVLLPYPVAMRTRVCDWWPGKPRDPDRLSDHSGLIVEIDFAA